MFEGVVASVLINISPSKSFPNLLLPVRFHKIIRLILAAVSISLVKVAYGINLEIESLCDFTYVKAYTIFLIIRKNVAVWVITEQNKGQKIQNLP